MRGWVKVLLAIAALPLLLLVFASFPITLPLIVLLGKLEDARRAADGKRAVCLACGRRLGPEAMEHADEAWAAHAKAMLAYGRANHLRINFRRHVYAICPACSARHGHDPKTRTFTLQHPNAY